MILFMHTQNQFSRLGINQEYDPMKRKCRNYIYLKKLDVMNAT